MTLVLAAALVAGGCDNIQWDGIQFGVHQPQPPVRETPDVEPDTVVAPALILPSGPVLFHVRRLDRAGRATIEAVAEIREGALVRPGPRRADQAQEYFARFGERYFAPEQRYLLARSGARVGSVIVTGPLEAGPGVCRPLRAPGQLELRPVADTMREFLAWPAGARTLADTLALPRSRGDMRDLSAILVDNLLRRRGVVGDWRVRAPARLYAVQVGTGELGFAATFVQGDSLAVGPAGDPAGMAFVVADHSSTRGYFALFFDATWYGPGGKRVLRWIDQAELTAVPPGEWVLRAYGEAGAWYEVVGQEADERRVIWSSRDPICEAQQPVEEPVAE